MSRQMRPQGWGTLHASGYDLPNRAMLLQAVDEGVAAAGEQVRALVTEGYRRAAPGRVASVVRTRVVRDAGYKLVVYIAGPGMGVPAGYWTNFGTGVHGPRKQPIRRRHGSGQVRGKRGRWASPEGPRPPFRLKNGAFTPEIQGQKPQGWVDNARRQADAQARVIVESQTDQRISDLMAKAMR